MNSRNILQNGKEKQLEEKSFQNLLITYCVLIVIQSFRNVLAQNRLQLTKIKKCNNQDNLNGFLAILIIHFRNKNKCSHQSTTDLLVRLSGQTNVLINNVHI